MRRPGLVGLSLAPSTEPKPRARAESVLGKHSLCNWDSGAARFMEEQLRPPVPAALPQAWDCFSSTSCLHTLPFNVLLALQDV